MTGSGRRRALLWREQAAQPPPRQLPESPYPMTVQPLSGIRVVDLTLLPESFRP